MEKPFFIGVNLTTYLRDIFLCIVRYAMSLRDVFLYVVAYTLCISR